MSHTSLTQCASCHEGRRPASHFKDQCSTCHNTTAWKPAVWVHKFPLTHNGANSVCATCHPALTKAYTFFNCHNQSEETKKHAEKKIIFPIDCMQCHPTGRKP